LKEEEEYKISWKWIYTGEYRWVIVGGYTPMACSSFIQLPEYIDRKRATINPQNTDQECFKWAILVRHVANN